MALNQAHSCGPALSCWGISRFPTSKSSNLKKFEPPEDDAARGPPARPWLARRVTITGRLGTPESTAGVDPRAFTTGLMRAAKMHGAVLRHDTVVDLVRGPSGALRGVALASGEIVAGDAVVIAMGPWSILAARWLPLPAVWGRKGHGLVFETGETIPAEAQFLEYREASGEILTPELFPRGDGTTWVCAISSAGPVPVDPATNGFGYWIPLSPGSSPGSAGMTGTDVAA